MNSRLEKAEQLSTQLSSKYREIHDLEAQVHELRKQAYEMKEQKIKNTILGNIEEGNLPTPESFKDDKTEDRDSDVQESEEMEDEEQEDDISLIDALRTLEKMYHRYGEEYVLPMGDFEFIPEDDWDGYDSVKSGIVINVDGKYIVDGQFQFDSIEALKQWALTKSYKEFISDKKNEIKLGTLKKVSLQQLEDMFDGKDISKEKLSKRERFEQALLRDDVIDFFLEKSPEEIEDFFGKDVARMVGFAQNNPHHCYDLFEHTLNVVDGIETEGLSQKDIIKLKVAAFFHDVGKPEVAKDKGDKTVYYNHAKKSAELAQDILGALGYKPEEIAQIQFYIEHHDDFINFKREDEEWNRNNRFLRGINLPNVARKIQATKEDISIFGGYNPTKKDYQLLLRLCKADANAQSRVVREYGKVTDSRANKIDRLTQVENLVPEAFDLALEHTADDIKKIARMHPSTDKAIGDKIDFRVTTSPPYIFGDGRKKVTIDDDLVEYEQELREAYLRDGGPLGEPARAKLRELFQKGMTQEQSDRLSKILSQENANKVIGGIGEIDRSGRLTELFDVKKVLIERNRDAEKLLRQYEERLRRQAIQQDK